MYSVGVLLNLVVSASHGEAEWITWATSLLALIVVAGFVAVLLPSVQRHVGRWDSAHEDGHS